MIEKADAAAVAPLRMSRASGSRGRIYFWQGGSLWIGRGSGRTDWHAHHAHQLALAAEGALRFRTGREGRWDSFGGALVPSHCTHQFEVDDIAMAHLFIEPESRAGRALAGRFGADAVASLPGDGGRAVAQALFEAFAASPDRSHMVAAAQQALDRLCGASTESDRALDPRLARALTYIRAHVREPLALGEVATQVALSESRFRHLFVAETGNSFRAYLLWLRINLAIEAVMAGANWTAAAHEAGFADSAHLARTHKRVFGIEPTALRLQPLPPQGV
ncbi:helix-turn-helix domain-containing protein [Aquabacterium sp.]|uniref:helix-turn-helix domain-containing protein n=1 Tax=Aquabacterium sp. TaxID=1872578 RepID=UPI003784A706